jgi:hypothetical protein
MMNRKWENKKLGLLSGAIFLCLTIFLYVSCNGNPPVSQQELEQMKSDHSAAKVIDGFHRLSYYAGTISTSAEFVSYGCKKLALSATLSEEELSALLPHAEQKAQEYGIPIHVEKDLLVTELFSPLIAQSKTVILFAYNQDVLDEYFSLKGLRENAIKEDRLEATEEEIAWRFGRLLSYTDETIERLLGEEK